MNTRQILALYRVVSITEINESNKRILVQQHLHGKKMDEMNENLRYSNQLQGKILDNQLKQIEHADVLKYYKNLAYNMKDVLKIIEKQTNANFKKFLIDLFGNAVTLNLTTAKKNLEEIADKSFCDDILDLTENTMLSATDNAPNYNKSSFYSLVKKDKEQERLKEVANKKKEQYNLQIAKEQEEKKCSKKGYIIGLGAISIFFLLMVFVFLVDSAFDAIPGSLMMSAFFAIPSIWIYWKEYKKKGKTLFYSCNTKLESDLLKEDYDHAESEAKNFDLSNEIVAIEDEVSNWENVMNTIHTLFPEPYEQKQEGNERDLDSYFNEAARLIVGSGQVSTSILQRKFNLGYYQAEQLINQLAVAGIVGPQKGNKPREVYINDIDTLEMILKNIHSNNQKK